MQFQFAGEELLLVGVLIVGVDGERTQTGDGLLRLLLQFGRQFAGVVHQFEDFLSRYLHARTVS
jgi:hypothetical protein